MAISCPLKSLNSRWLLPASLALAAMPLLLGGCSRATDPWKDVPGSGPKVLASFPPVYCFTKAVAGDHARVLCLLTAIDPHDYQPTSSGDNILVRGADVFIINGLSLDDDLRSLPGSESKVKLVNLGELLEEKDHELVLPIHGHKEEADHKHDHGHHHHGSDDPHTWLGMAQARAMVRIIAEQLSAVAPEHKDHYHKNAEAYIKKLDELAAHGKKALAEGKDKGIIATHDSMQYFAKSFHLNVVDFLMPQAGVDADAKKFHELVKRSLDPKAAVRVITVEPQWADRNAKTLQSQIRHALEKEKRPAELAPKLVPFDTLETTADAHFGADYYLTKMRENIDNLARALK